ncbi:serotriflin [Aplysia californica]|uniref:Serotriflin n=1 Tax=Aplysia californica TaxID=6500 RepID=A0ABM0ZZA2_APLCA|nr:serotriflin [Aplysia californica]
MILSHLTSAPKGYLIFSVILTLRVPDAVAAYCHPKFRQSVQIPAGHTHTACLDKSPVARSRVPTEAEKKEIVDLHNQLRARVQPPATNMLKLSWDDELAMLAQKWAEACDKEDGELHHDTYRSIPGRFSVGQNLMMGGKNFKGGINGWYIEHKDYTYGEKTGPAEFARALIGHYTQLAWARTYKIGCGAADCDGRSFFVCNYGPAGNIVPFKGPYETGRRCSKCKTCVDDGLCDCKHSECYGSSTLNTETCACECKKFDFLEAPDCHVNCTGSGKDARQCGRKKNFVEKKCTEGFVQAACPHQCRVCPYSDPSYKDDTAELTSPSMLMTWVLTTLTVAFLCLL